MAEEKKELTPEEEEELRAAEVLRIATEVLTTYKEAFEELAK